VRSEKGVFGEGGMEVRSLKCEVRRLVGRGLVGRAGEGSEK
jgi:hypothetical protein